MAPPPAQAPAEAHPLPEPDPHEAVQTAPSDVRAQQGS